MKHGKAMHVVGMGLALATLAACQPNAGPGRGGPAGKAGGPHSPLAPPIEAAGWINGSAPTAEGMKGRVVVLDVWAYW